MNDIGVKVVESPKAAVDEASLAPGLGESEQDPLAIDDEESRSKEVGPAGPPENCDDDAKEETSAVVQKEDEQNYLVPTDDNKEEFKEATELKEVSDEIKECREAVTEDSTSKKPDEPESETPAVASVEILDPATNPPSDPEAALLNPKFDPPTPELASPPPEEETEEISPPEIINEVRALTPEAKVPEVTVTKATTLGPKISKEKHIHSTDVEMTELPVHLQQQQLPQTTLSSQSIQFPQSVKLPQSMQIPQKLQLPQTVQLPPSIQLPQTLPPAQSVQLPQSIHPSQKMQLPQSVQSPTVMQSSLPTPELPVQMETLAPSISVKNLVAEKETKIPVEEKVEQKEVKPVQPLNGDIAKEEMATKRRASEDVETDSPLKRLCQEVEKTFPQHDTMINDYIQTATKNNIDEIQRHTEQLLAEIQTLRELAQKKEHEWNNILHLKKVKEEILLRLLRRKQVLSFEKSVEVNGAERPGIDPFDFLNQAKNLAIDKSDEISGLSIKQPGSTMNPMMQAPIMPVTTHFNPMVGLPPPYDKAAQMHMQNMSKPVFPQSLMMPGTLPGFPRDMNGQLSTNFNMPMGRQGPTKDVKSIIADYRQRNPDITPRRGRRMKSILNPNMMNAPRAIAPKVDQMNNMNNLSNLNMLFNNMDMEKSLLHNQKAMLERLQQIQAGGLPNSIFKDALVQFANMQQASSGMLPTRPPETITNRPEHHKERRRERNHEQHKPPQPERMASTSPRLPPPPPYPEISLLPVSTAQDTQSQQNSLLHGILTKPAPPQSFSPTLAKLLTSPERKSASAPAVLPTFGQAKNCGEITITPVQPTPPADPQPEKAEDVVQLDDEESPVSEGEAAGSPQGSGRLVIDETSAEGADTPLCQGCRRRDAQFVCAGCANQWYCSRECQVAAWDDHSEMCSG